jgi:DNA-directed RNA polymerase sigma subunit (sigma70/sigma32)
VDAHGELAAAMSFILESMESEPPISRINTAAELHKQLLDLQARVAAVKRNAVRELREQGFTFAEIGRELGITTSRVKQIETGRK